MFTRACHLQTAQTTTAFQCARVFTKGQTCKETQICSQHQSFCRTFCRTLAKYTPSVTSWTFQALTTVWVSEGVAHQQAAGCSQTPCIFSRTCASVASKTMLSYSQNFHRTPACQGNGHQSELLPVSHKGVMLS